MPPEPEKSGVRLFCGAAVAWLAVCGGAVCAAMLGVLSVASHRSAVEIEHAYVALVVGQAFFILFVWPLFERRHAGGPVSMGVRLVALMVLAAPFVLLAAQTSNIGPGIIARSQGLVLLLGVAAGAAVRLPDARSWYLPSVFLLTGVVPLAAYLLFEEGAVPALWARPLSPLWAAGSVAAGASVPAPLLVFAGVGAAALLVHVLRRRAVSPDQG